MPGLQEGVKAGDGCRIKAFRCTQLGPDTTDAEVGQETVLVACRNAYGRTLRGIFRIWSSMPSTNLSAAMNTGSTV